MISYFFYNIKFLMVMKYVFALLLAGISIHLMSQDFRNANWGESIDMVKSKETATLIPEKSKGNMLYYKSTLGEKNVEIAYKFISNKLVRATYIFVEKYTNKNVYYSDFLNFKTLLTKKYGDPHKYDQRWSNDTYKYEVGYMGQAISLGHVVVVETWKRDKTRINHAIYRKNDDIEHIIEYISVNFAYLEKEKEEKTGIDDL